MGKEEQTEKENEVDEKKARKKKQIKNADTNANFASGSDIKSNEGCC